MGKCKAVVWGVGKVFQYFLQTYDPEKLEVVALCDNDPEKHGKSIQGFLVFSPAQLKDIDFNIAIITTLKSQEVKKQLAETVGEVKVLDYSDIYRRLNPLEDDVWNEYLKMDFLKLLYGQKSDNLQKEIMKLERRSLELERKSLFLSAKIISNTYSNKAIKSLEEVEFQVFSQFGEDGIIQWLINNVNIKKKVFIEFGVENYTESNTRYLLMNNNWSGLVIEGNEEYARQITDWDMRWRYDLTVVSAFITKDNINNIITDAGFGGEIGILSIDIDGNDYWILKAIECVKPQILICEYNNLFGNEKKLTIPYREDFCRPESCNGYFGASLQAFCDFAEKHDYYYLGSSSAGLNAFFVKKDSIEYSKIPINSNEFIVSKYRESRDTNGKLNYLNRDQRLNEMKNMELVDLDNGELRKISDIFSLL